MLILSRRTGEEILFPGLGISLEITRIRGKSATVGVKAPKGIKVLRGEIADSITELSEKVINVESGLLGRKEVHDIRNQLNSVVLGMHVVQRQVEKKELVDIDLIRKAFEELKGLEHKLQQLSSKNQTEKSQARSALLVEDNENESTLLSGFLRTHDFRVANATDGEGALNYLRFCNQLPDVILLDMNMPKLNGPQTVDIIRNDESLKHLKLFAVSGSDPKEFNLKVGSPDGVDRWFCKPIRPDKLVESMCQELVA